MVLPSQRLLFHISDCTWPVGTCQKRISAPTMISSQSHGFLARQNLCGCSNGQGGARGGCHGKGWEGCFSCEEWDGMEGEISQGWLHFGARSFLTWFSPFISHLLKAKTLCRSLAFKFLNMSFYVSSSLCSPSISDAANGYPGAKAATG